MEIELTKRERAMLAFALYNLMRTGQDLAEQAAQDKLRLRFDDPAKAFLAFTRDAADAAMLRDKLAKLFEANPVNE